MDVRGEVYKGEERKQKRKHIMTLWCSYFHWGKEEGERKEDKEDKEENEGNKSGTCYKTEEKTEEKKKNKKKTQNKRERTKTEIPTRRQCHHHRRLRSRLA